MAWIVSLPPAWPQKSNGVEHGIAITKIRQQQSLESPSAEKSAPTRGKPRSHSIFADLVDDVC
jgi:hypothetical protein